MLSCNAAVDRNDTGTGEASEKGVNQTNDLIEEEVVDEVVILENSISVEENDEVKEFRCELCDFKSNNRLRIHMARKHSKLEQLDGNNTFNEESDDEKYSSIEHYLKNGWLGSAYQNFIDANDVIVP